MYECWVRRVQKTNKYDKCIEKSIILKLILCKSRLRDVLLQRYLG